MFEQYAPSVLNCYIQSSSVELHHRNAEFKPKKTKFDHNKNIILLKNECRHIYGSITTGDVSSCENPRLIINRVQSLLHGARPSPPRPALVRQQIQTYEGIGAVFGEGYQVTTETQAPCYTENSS